MPQDVGCNCRIIRLRSRLVVGGLLAHRCKVSIRSSMSSITMNTAKILSLMVSGANVCAKVYGLI